MARWGPKLPDQRLCRVISALESYSLTDNSESGSMMLFQNGRKEEVSDLMQ